MAFLGNPEYGCDLQPIDFAAFARACGATGLTVDDPAQCSATLRRALDTPGPVVVEAVVDPDTAPLPAKIRPAQALHFAEAMAKGEPGRFKIMRNIFKDKVRELI